MEAERASDGATALTEAEEALLKAALAGEIADLRRRTVSAAVVRDLLIEARPGWRLSHHGLRLERAIISGHLDLEGALVTKPFVLRHSRIEGSAEHGAINVRDARLKRLGIHSSTLIGGVNADRLEVESGLFIGSSRIEGFVQVRGANVTGALAVEACEFGDGRMALNAAGVTVSGPLIVRRSKIRGELALPRARLGAGVYGDHIELVSEAVAINADGARLGGDLCIDDGQIKGAVRLANAHIEGRLAGERVVMAGPAMALVADGATITQGVNLTEARAQGALAFDGAVIGKGLRAAGLQIEGSEMSVSADVAEIGGNWEMPRARLVGHIRCPGLRLEGQLRLTEAKIFGSDLAIRADGARVRGGCFMARAVIVGLVRFPAAEIANQFRLSGATLKVDHGAALLASGSRFLRDVELGGGLQTVGAIVLDQAVISGACDLRGSHLKSARIARGSEAGKPQKTRAGAANHARADELSLSLVDARVGRLQMPERAEERPRGIVDLSRAQVGSFEDWSAAWPPPVKQRARAADGREIDHLVLDGFVYDHMSNPAGMTAGAHRRPDDRVGERRVAWLEGQETPDLVEHFKPQAWVTLSARLAAQGYVDDACALDIERRRRERRSHRTRWSNRWQSRLLDWLALYGHNPWRTVVWMFVVVLGFAGLWGWAAGHCRAPGCLDETVMVVTNRDAYTAETFAATYPAFHAVGYSLDVFVPFVSLGYDDHWRPNLDFGPLWTIPIPREVLDLVPDGPTVTSRVRADGPAVVTITVGTLLYVVQLLETLLGLVLTSLAITGFSGLLTRGD